MQKFGLPTFSRKKLILIGFLFVLLIGIPLTVFLVQQQQQTATRATQSTTLALSPADKTVNVGDPVELDVNLDPGGVNQVSFVKFVLTYDPTKLTPSGTSFTVNQASQLTILQGPTVDTNTLTVTLSVGSAFQNAIQNPTTIGKVFFDAVESTTGFTPITFDQTQTQIRSLGTADTAPENVFLSGAPAQITIRGEATSNTFDCTLAANPTSVPVSSTSVLTATCTETPTAFDPTKATFDWAATCGTVPAANSLTNTWTAPATGGVKCTVSVNICNAAGKCSKPTANIDVTATAATQQTSTSSAATQTNAAPVCQSLTTDGSEAGTAPYAVTFTATGQDSDGTISKVTFNFGDGVVEDITQGSGTNSISAQTSHTYNSTGTFSATATITDSSGGTSNPTTCTKIITVSSAIGGETTPSITPVTGPDRSFIGIGIIGAALSLIGMLLFFAL